MGLWEPAQANRADKSSEDIYGCGEAAPTGFPAV